MYRTHAYDEPSHKICVCVVLSAFITEISLKQLEAGAPLPPPSMLKRKILIKNKRLNADVEKQELELFKQGQFVIEENEIKEDASAPPTVAVPVEQQSVKVIIIKILGLSMAAILHLKLKKKKKRK